MYVIYFFKENEQNINQYILKVKYESLVHDICEVTDVKFRVT